MTEIPSQQQEWPGRTADLDPRPDHGESWIGRDRLRGKRVLVTGGDSGIGPAVAVLAAKEGAAVVAITHLPEEKIRRRFPHISQMCREFGLDVTRDRIPVRPGAHYMVGGATIDADGRTTLPHLWAAGEVTSSGLHGANRLASNSLLEGLYYGIRAGRGASAEGGAAPPRTGGLLSSRDGLLR